LRSCCERAKRTLSKETQVPVFLMSGASCTRKGDEQWWVGMGADLL